MRWVYDFAEGSREMRELLGGKGANVAEMTRVLGTERVPPGFTITTEACVAYMREGHEPDGLEDQVARALQKLQELAGKRFGDDEDPLLVSVRSGARESMPGMLDTILNLGLNDRSVQGLARATENGRFAWDSYRRLVQMFGNVAHGVPGERFEDAISDVKRSEGVQIDAELSTDALVELVERFKGFYEFPQDAQEQLQHAIRAVFESWTGERAVQYRRINRIPDDWGTAVNVQQMVFGNKGETSATGVVFSRDEVTGAPEPSGDFLVNAQGEDVVSGVRTPRDIAELAEVMPEADEQLREILRMLESHDKNMQDTEFTIEEGHLWMLQTRNAKRPAQAAVRFAVDAVSEQLLTPAEALATIDASSLDALLHPTFDQGEGYNVLARGVAASPGAAAGAIVFSAPEAVAAAAEGRDVILVRPFTAADDVAGFHAAKGILTSEGGKASHAALVARGMGVPAVTGAASTGETPNRSSSSTWPASTTSPARRSGCRSRGSRRPRRRSGNRGSGAGAGAGGRAVARSRLPRRRRRLAAVGPDEEAAAARAQDLDAAKSAAGEHLLQLGAAVVEDRTVADPLVADLADWALQQRPARERADHAAAGGGQLEHLAGELPGVWQVVEQPQGQDHLERTVDGRAEEVLDDQLGAGLEALQAVARERDHRLGEVDPHVVRRAGLEHELADPARAAPHVEDPRFVVAGDRVRRQLPAAEQPRAQQPDQRPLVLVEVIELLSLVAEATTNALRRRR